MRAQTHLWLGFASKEFVLRVTGSNLRQTPEQIFLREAFKQELTPYTRRPAGMRKGLCDPHRCA